MEAGRSNGTPPDYLVNANERQYLAKLCWLLHEAGTRALRLLFDAFHPPLSLRPHLAQQHVKSALKKLHEQKVLTESQWRMLYPTRKQDAASLTSGNFDASLLTVLLQTICHLSPPYPHGWSAVPLPQDSSLSADVVRLKVLLQQAGSLGGVRHEEYPILWRQIVQVLLRMGGPDVRVTIARINEETLTPEEQTHYISLVKDVWGSGEEEEEGEAGRGRGRSSGTQRLAGREGGKRKMRGKNGPKRSPESQNSVQHEGLSAEDRLVLSRTERQLCDGVMAEDIVDRLVQNHVINFSERQEILTPGKSSDRMHILLAKILHNRQPQAFRVFQDALKFKFPQAFDVLTQAKKQVLKEGVPDSFDLLSFCQEGLATHYRSILSRVTPLPWMNIHCSIRDVYVPLDVCTEDGKKLQLSQILPSVVTSGRGKRVIMEGGSGSGKSFLAAMLTFQWAGQESYFSNTYRFLLYLDARRIRGPLYKAVHSQVLPDNFSIGAKEFWDMLESNARDVIFIIHGLDDAESHQELKQLVCGDILRHASILLTSRPGPCAAGWMDPDERIYVMGLSGLNVGRCLKSYAVVAHMTSEEYEEFNEVISNPGFEFRSQMGTPYLCLSLLGVYQALGEEALISLTSPSTLLQRFLVAMATLFSRKHHLGDAESPFSPYLLAAFGEMQSLAYRSLWKPEGLMVSSDLTPTLGHLRAAASENAERKFLVNDKAPLKDIDGMDTTSPVRDRILDGIDTRNRLEKEKAERKESGNKATKEQAIRQKVEKVERDVTVKIKDESREAEKKEGSDINDASELLFKQETSSESEKQEDSEHVNQNRKSSDEQNRLNGHQNGVGERFSNSGENHFATNSLEGGEKQSQHGGDDGNIAEKDEEEERRKEHQKQSEKHHKVLNSTDLSFLSNLGLLNKMAGARGFWSFTCSMTRDFLAARHLADMTSQGLKGELSERKLLQHPRFAQALGFLSGLLRQREGRDTEAFVSLFNAITLQVSKQKRQSSPTQNNGEKQNGLPSSQNFIQHISPCLHALAEAAPLPGKEVASDLAKVLPRFIEVHPDGLVPERWWRGLSEAVKLQDFPLTRVNLHLQPQLGFQAAALHSLAQALADKETLQILIVRWHSLPLLSQFLTTCLSKAPPLQLLLAEHVNRRCQEPIQEHVSAVTWTGLEEACSLARNVQTLGFRKCGWNNVVTRWMQCMPDTVPCWDFRGCAVNAISAAELGAKLEKSSFCRTLDLSNTRLETSDLMSLLHCLKRNTSLHRLNLSGSRIDRTAASLLAHYICLNSSLRTLLLKRCHVVDEACRQLVDVLARSTSMIVLDLSGSEVGSVGREILTKGRKENGLEIRGEF